LLDENGVQVATQNLMPDWLKTMFAFCEANPDKLGIVHLDEINHIRKDMQSFIFQMALDKKLHQWQFLPNMKVVCSANPPTNDYSGVFDFSNKALLSRFCHLKLTPTTAEWLEFAEANGFDEDVTAYIGMEPDNLDPKLEVFSIDNYAGVNRRSWEFFSRLKKEGADRELLSGIIGTASTAKFFTWLDQNKEKSIKAVDVIEDYPKVRKQVQKLVAEGRIASLVTLSQLVQAEVLKLPESALVTMPKERDNLAAYMLDLPPEGAWTFTFSLIQCPAIHYGPNVAGAPTTDPGSVFGPHTYPKLLEVFTKYAKLGIADKVKDQLTAEPAAEVEKKATKKKASK
jgi:hypothetical protein